MASSGPDTTSLPHRAVSGVRASQSTKEGSSGQLRSLSSLFGTPGASRNDDDPIVIELGCRKVRVGFSGDPVPKRVCSFDPEQTRRAGDFRAWEEAYEADWRVKASGESWSRYHELWQLEWDMRRQDLDLVGDRLERALQDAFTRFLLVDSRPRKMSLVLPHALALPLLSTVLDVLFKRFHCPTVSLFSSPVMAAFAAGVRSALVIDIGWHETTVTGIYEYRQVRSWRTVRAGKMLLERTRDLLQDLIRGRPATDAERDEEPNDLISFEECDEVAVRMLWCRKAQKPNVQPSAEGLPTLHEQDETETIDPAEDSSPTDIRLTSCRPPRTVQIPFSSLAEPCETSFFECRYSPSSFDEDELPLHILAYRSLLQLPMDVRGMCMSRIILTGGCSAIVGLKERILDETCMLAHERGWDPIQGKAVDAYRAKAKLGRNGSRQEKPGEPSAAAQPPGERPAGEEEATTTDEPSPPQAAHHAPARRDQVEELMQQERKTRPVVQGRFRALDSLGPWCGASLATQLKVPAMAIVDRDLWHQQGVHGAARAADVDVKTLSRQSLGHGGLGGRGQAGQSVNWTLGVWGVV